MPYDKSKPYSCPCCGYWNGDMKYDYYKPTEPLIKDEKIRKAVRAWAEANKEKTCLCYNADENSLTDIYRNEIAFNSMLDLEDCKEYSIAELCGEEEK